jgi:hypothetical protein
VKLLVTLATVLLTGAAVRVQAATLICPPRIFANTSATQCFAVVNYPKAIGSGVGGVTCNPPPGSELPIGDTTVTCEAVATTFPFPRLTCSFTVTVSDRGAPSITCPPNVTTPTDAGLCGALLSFEPTATDACSGVTLVQIQGLLPGSLFPLGIVHNRFRAIDAGGNTATCEQIVTVSDAEKPHLSCPDMVVSAPGPVDYQVAFTDNCDFPVPIFFDPPSGSQFDVGTTRVAAAAQDFSNNLAVCSFTVTVAPPPTTTTLPPGCPVAATLPSVACRVGELTPTVAAVTTDPARTRLGRLVDQAGEFIAQAETLGAAGRRKPTARAIRKSIARLGRFRKKVLAKKSGIAEPTRSQLATAAEALVTDLRAILGS